MVPSNHRDRLLILVILFLAQPTATWHLAELPEMPDMRRRQARLTVAYAQAVTLQFSFFFIG
jgi:hypothetical protein